MIEVYSKGFSMAHNIQLLRVIGIVMKSPFSYFERNSSFRKILRTVCRPGRKNQGREVLACVAPPIFGCLSSSAHLIHGNSSFEATPTTLHLCPSLNSPCSPEQSCLTMLFPGTGFFGVATPHLTHKEHPHAFIWLQK